MKIFNYNSFFLLALLVGLASCNVQPLYPISDIEEEFEGINKLVVEAGAIEISYEGSAEADRVYLNAFVEANDETMEGVSFRRSGDQLFVSFDPDINMSFFFGNRVKGFISLSGPENMALEMVNSSGKLEVDQVVNDQVSLRASSGKIEGRNIHSDNLNVRASSGMIKLENIEGNLELRVSSGMATLEDMKGDVEFRGSSGMLNIYRVDGLVSGSMSSGKANLQQIGKLGEISISSGMLEAEECGLDGQTSLSASSGYMKVTSTTVLKAYNYDFSVGSGRLTIGDRSTSEDLYIDNGASTTIKGRLQSGKLDLREL